MFNNSYKMDPDARHGRAAVGGNVNVANGEYRDALRIGAFELHRPRTIVLCVKGKKPAESVLVRL